ncbi:MAG: polysaccharide deacetylase family protein [Candidatus Eisenbacteria bacterium]
MNRFERYVLKCLGAFGEKIKRKTLPPILTYHSIDSSDSVVSVSPGEFAWQMRYLKEFGFETVLLRDYLANRGTKRFSPGRVAVITFDDAFRSVKEQALPVMQELGFTGTVFVPTAHVGETPGWRMDSGLPASPLMDWSELSAMLEAGFDVQSHTHNHRSLAALDAPEIEQELEQSRSAIETNLNHQVDLLAYPYGDYTDTAIGQLMKAGFRGAVSVEFGLNPPGTDPFRLKRVGSAHFSDHAAFRACVWGMYGPLLTMKKIRIRESAEQTLSRP